MRCLRWRLARGFRGGWTDVCVCTFVCMGVSACELLCLRVRACARVHEPPLRVPVPRVSRVMGRASRKSPRTMRVRWMLIVCEDSVLTHLHLFLPSSLLSALPPAAASTVPLLRLSPSLPTPSTAQAGTLPFQSPPSAAHTREASEPWGESTHLVQGAHARTHARMLSSSPEATDMPSGVPCVGTMACLKPLLSAADGPFLRGDGKEDAGGCCERRVGRVRARKIDFSPEFPRCTGDLDPSAGHQQSNEMRASLGLRGGGKTRCMVKGCREVCVCACVVCARVCMCAGVHVACNKTTFKHTYAHMRS